MKNLFCSVLISLFFSRDLNFRIIILPIEEKVIVKENDGKYIFKILISWRTEMIEYVLNCLIF